MPTKLVWSNNRTTHEDYEQLLESYKEGLVEMGESEEDVKDLSIDSSRFNDWYNEYIDNWLSSERDNLDIKTENTIIMVADLGLWYGRRSGVGIVGNNVKDCLSSDCDYVTWECDKYNLISSQAHHDGTNYITYREMKDDKHIQLLQDKAYSGTLTKQDITRYTRSIKPLIDKVYGW